MKDMRQIILIGKYLNKMRDGYVDDLTKINKLIETKISVKNKMIFYQNEYLDTSKYAVSKSNPALNKNLHSFTRKINVAIDKVNDEINAIEAKKEIIIQKIEAIDKKIELMGMFEAKLKTYNLKLSEMKEQALYDSVTTIKQLRGEHE